MRTPFAASIIASLALSTWTTSPARKNCTRNKGGGNLSRVRSAAADPLSARGWWSMLLQTPAAVRFVSYEPALGPLKLYLPWIYTRDVLACGG